MSGYKQSRWWVFVLVCAAWTVLGRAQDSELNERDILVYHDGDRVQGTLKQERDGVILFVSDRFGELKIPSTKAVVIKGVRAEAAVAVEMAESKTIEAPPVADDAVKPEPVGQGKWYSGAMLTSYLRDSFNNWHGRFAFSSESVQSSSNQAKLSLELSLKRKWTEDEVQLKGRYDFSQTEGRTTVDMVKADGLWRRDFKKKSFMLYRPSVEWSQATYKLGVPSDYVLVQQEFGFGRTVFTNNKYKVRLGASENLFDVWSIVPGNEHHSLTSESAFIETELKIPWGMLLTQRGVLYYSFNSGDEGSESRVELTKKFSETLSAALRHELRRGSPDSRAQDYTRLKLLLGIDF